MDKIEKLKEKFNNPNLGKGVKQSIKEKIKVLKDNKIVNKWYIVKN